LRGPEKPNVWSPVHWPWYIIVLFCAVAAAVLTAVACLAAAIYPRGRAEADQKPTTIGYFGDVLMLDSPKHLRELLSGSSAQLLDVWIDQIWQTSMIVGRKYRFIRWYMRLLGMALALAVILVVAVTLRMR
jgi:hypothetical protein